MIQLTFHNHQSFLIGTHLLTKIHAYVLTVSLRVAVTPSAQGRGIAQKFIEYAEQVARGKGYSYVRVDTNSMNETMQRLFKRCGFQFIQDINLKNKPGLSFKLFEKKLV